MNGKGADSPQKAQELNKIAHWKLTVFVHFCENIRARNGKYEAVSIRERYNFVDAQIGTRGRFQYKLGTSFFVLLYKIELISI